MKGWRAWGQTLLKLLPQDGVCTCSCGSGTPCPGTVRHLNNHLYRWCSHYIPEIKSSPTLSWTCVGTQLLHTVNSNGSTNGTSSSWTWRTWWTDYQNEFSMHPTFHMNLSITVALVQPVTALEESREGSVVVRTEVEAPGAAHWLMSHHWYT